MSLKSLLHFSPPGTGMQIPAAAASALNVAVQGGLPMASNSTPPIATQCFMLSNMFDPAT